MECQILVDTEPTRVNEASMQCSNLICPENLREARPIERMVVQTFHGTRSSGREVRPLASRNTLRQCINQCAFIVKKCRLVVIIPH